MCLLCGGGVLTGGYSETERNRVRQKDKGDVKVTTEVETRRLKGKKAENIYI